MDQITAEMFEPELENYARQQFENKYKNDNRFIQWVKGWDIIAFEKSGMIQLQDKEDFSGKIGKCTYNIAMKPAGVKLIRKNGSVKIKVTGEYNIVDGVIQGFTGTDYSFFDENIPNWDIPFLGDSPMPMDSIPMDSIETE